jgi:hypothetical protein
LSCDNIQAAYDQFLEAVKLHTQMRIPVKFVRVGKRDPVYVNPCVKVPFAKRTKFRQHGNNAAADKLARAINNTRSRLRKLANASVKWSALKLNRVAQDSNNRVHHLLADVDSVNKYFASISFHHAYNQQLFVPNSPMSLPPFSRFPLMKSKLCF